MAGTLFVTLSDIYMVKMENDVVISSKYIFYQRFINIHNRQKLRENGNQWLSSLLKKNFIKL